MGKISPPPRRSSKKGFTLIELLVTISIIAVLASLLLPVYSGVQESSRSSKCVSNLRQIGAAMALYANDNNGLYPPLEDNSSSNVNWDSGAINPYLPERPDKRQSVLFICPDANYKGDVNNDLSRTYSATECMIGPAGSYHIGNNRTDFASMTGTMVLFDAAQSGTLRYASEIVTWVQVSNGGDLKAKSTSNTYIDYRHRNAFHGLFADGHVDTITRVAAPTLITKAMWTGNSRP